MKYLVNTGSVLRFPDGSQVELTPGVHSFDKRVTEHWAFGAHAQAISEEDLKQSQGGEDLSLRVAVLETTITDLQQQLSDKETTITDLQQQLDELTNKSAETEQTSNQETGNAKKQSSANK